MRIVDLAQQVTEEWRPGVKTKMRASAANGATQLCMFEQWCGPGQGAPTHLHAVEEVARNAAALAAALRLMRFS